MTVSSLAGLADGDRPRVGGGLWRPGGAEGEPRLTAATPVEIPDAAVSGGGGGGGAPDAGGRGGALHGDRLRPDRRRQGALQPQPPMENPYCSCKLTRCDVDPTDMGKVHRRVEAERYLGDGRRLAGAPLCASNGPNHLGLWCNAAP